MYIVKIMHNKPISGTTCACYRIRQPLGVMFLKNTAAGKNKELLWETGDRGSSEHCQHSSVPETLIKDYT
jgi:hypothetical protein